MNRNDIKIKLSRDEFTSLLAMLANVVKHEVNEGPVRLDGKQTELVYACVHRIVQNMQKIAWRYEHKNTNTLKLLPEHSYTLLVIHNALIYSIWASGYQEHVWYNIIGIIDQKTA